MEPLIEQRQGLPLGSFVCLFLSDQAFNLILHEAADGCGATSGQDPRLLKRLFGEADGEVLLLVRPRLVFGGHHVYYV